MKLRDLAPILHTKDLKGSIEFYRSVLNFECDAIREDLGWASVTRDNVTIMFALPNAHLPFDKPTFTGSFYVYPDNVDDAWEQVRDKASVCYPVEDFDYGMREFAIYDNNGYMIQFGQEIE